MNARTLPAQVDLLDVDVILDARIDRSRSNAKARIAAGACSGCAKRAPRPGLKTCGECNASVSRARSREAANPKPKVVAFFIVASDGGNAWQGPTLLAEDDDAGEHYRRNVDCARLTACERDWTDRANASGDIGTQAQCPAVCACYSNRWRRVL